MGRNLDLWGAIWSPRALFPTQYCYGSEKQKFSPLKSLHLGLSLASCVPQPFVLFTTLFWGNTFSDSFRRKSTGKEDFRDILKPVFILAFSFVLSLAGYRSLSYKSFAFNILKILPQRINQLPVYFFLGWGWDISWLRDLGRRHRDLTCSEANKKIFKQFSLFQHPNLSLPPPHYYLQNYLVSLIFASLDILPCNSYFLPVCLAYDSVFWNLLIHLWVFYLLSRFKSFTALILSSIIPIPQWITYLK